ncbi:MAG: phage tail tube protein [Eubacteriales bacterium]|nr:phage tail tube protein [Eubacteriales bacterium]
MLRSNDAISGQEGKATAIINGNVVDMFYLKTLEAGIDKRKKEIRSVGTRGTSHKASGFNGTGTMTIYYITSIFRKMMLDYIKTGVDTYFTITAYNDDPGSTVGRQTIVLYRVNLDSVAFIKLDSEMEGLEEDVAFTFEDIDMLDQFGNPVVL